MYNNLLVAQKGQISYITINRPKQLNALNGATISELNHAISAADKDTSVSCIILTGSDTKAFVAGADIKEFAAFDKNAGRRTSSERTRNSFFIY